MLQNFPVLISRSHVNGPSTRTWCIAILSSLIAAGFLVPNLLAANNDDGTRSPSAPQTAAQKGAEPGTSKGSSAGVSSGPAGVEGIDGIVITPNGRPAAKAQVALGVPGSRITIRNGKIKSHLTDADRTETDQFGRFHFPPERFAFYLVITHPTGYVRFKPQTKTDRRIINLDPWTRVEGTFRVGGKPQAGVRLTIMNSEMIGFGNGMPDISLMYEATTGPDGHFVFDRVIAGRGFVGRECATPGSDDALKMTSSCLVATKFPVGKALHIDLGTTGQSVVGKLRTYSGFKRNLRWDYALLQVRAERIEGLPPESYFQATVGPDGAFRIDDMPPGDYSMIVDLAVFRAGRLDGHRFTVPRKDANPSAKPLDLGVLTLEKE